MRFRRFIPWTLYGAWGTRTDQTHYIRKSEHVPYSAALSTVESSFSQNRNLGYGSDINSNIIKTGDNESKSRILPYPALPAYTVRGSSFLQSRNLKHSSHRHLNFNNIKPGDYSSHPYSNKFERPSTYRTWGKPHRYGAHTSTKSNTLSTAEFVRRKIAEYYAARQGKSRNTWMYKLVKGTPRHIREIFIGRCWEFLSEKALYVEKPEKLNCSTLWNAFVGSFAHKGPCAASFEDYKAFFNLYHEKPLVDRVGNPIQYRVINLQKYG